ncbi:TIGR01777 family oxidoreductase [Geitlerinema sp. PCC 9228]|jgi:hypothetical protein|uniref:thylakoid membrane protein ThyD n=1 Tax=Geitlerinema sp. PCC 9228 TaxID=111611 RepID=UPI0008F9ADCD|nr:TIGR01777 family oxidoreductase [Geitlerinema sp. PCC 9228]
MKIAITGATGFVGSRLVQKLHQQGHSLLVFTRSSQKAKRMFPPSAFANLEVVTYTPTQSGEWQNALSGCDGVVNLAGTPIADERWTSQRQQSILDSRQLGTQKIVEAMANANPQPAVLVNPSAVGYYGTSETDTFDETSSPGNDFLAQVCQKWEAAAEEVKNHGTRLVIFRFGIVVGPGGAVEKMLLPFKLFMGGPLGEGNQWFSWIHREDLVDFIIRALQDPQVAGTFNATTPNPVRMKELCQVLGEVMHRPSWLPVPSFALELLLGDAAKVVLEGQKVLPKRTQEAGFEYQYPDIQSALKATLES